VTQAFVFVNSKLGCARLARSLERDGLRTTALHGDKSQDERLKALDAFKKGEVDLLVCTDVAARGLDIKDVPAVFNIDIPFNAEDYVHRIGRTGRAGASGLAVSFVTGRDARLVSDIEKLIGKKIEQEAIELQPERRSGDRFNDGQRRWRDEERQGERVERAPRDAAPRPRYTPRTAPADPFLQALRGKPARHGARLGDGRQTRRPRCVAQHQDPQKSPCAVQGGGLSGLTPAVAPGGRALARCPPCGGRR